MKNNLTKPYKIFTAGQDSIFWGEVRDELGELMTNETLEFAEVPDGIDEIKQGDAIVFSTDMSFAGAIKAKAIKAKVPLVLLDTREKNTANFSVEEPIFFAAMDSDVRSVAEFISLIMLFNRKIKLAEDSETLEERIELLDDVVADFGNSLNSKLCTIIGYADFALSEASLEEMQKALQISLEAGLDTAQLLQNMLLSVKAIVRKKKKRWAA